MVNFVTKPYEILIRFNYEIGELAGGLRGLHLEQKSFMVDDAGKITGRIDAGRQDDPADFPADQVVAFLGEQFSTFHAQHVALQDAHKALQADHEVLSRDHIAFRAAHEAALAEHAVLQAAHDALKSGYEDLHKVERAAAKKLADVISAVTA